MRNESRSSPRLRRRYQVALKAAAAGDAEAMARVAFTVDVSEGGFCAELMRVPSPGTQVTGTISIDGREYAFSGKIAWARAGAPRMNVRGRFGVTFSELADELKKKLT